MCWSYIVLTALKNTYLLSLDSVYNIDPVSTWTYPSWCQVFISLHFVHRFWDHSQCILSLSVSGDAPAHQGHHLMHWGLTHIIHISHFHCECIVICPCSLLVATPGTPCIGGLRCLWYRTPTLTKCTRFSWPLQDLLCTLNSAIDDGNDLEHWEDNTNRR